MNYEYINQILNELAVKEDIDNIDNLRNLYSEVEDNKKKFQIHILMIYYYFNSNKINDNSFKSLLEEIKIKHKEDDFLINEESYIIFLNDLFKTLYLINLDPTFLFFKLEKRLQLLFTQTYFSIIFESIIQSSQGFNKFYALIQYSFICYSTDTKLFNDIVKEKLENYLNDSNSNKDNDYELSLVQYKIICELFFMKDDSVFLNQLFNLIKNLSLNIKNIFDFESFLYSMNRLFLDTTINHSKKQLFSLYIQILIKVSEGINLTRKKKSTKVFFKVVSSLVSLLDTQNDENLNHYYSEFNNFLNRKDYHSQIIIIDKIFKKNLDSSVHPYKENLIKKYINLAYSMKFHISNYFLATIGTISLNEPNLNIQKIGEECISNILNYTLIQLDGTIEERIYYKYIYIVLKNINNKKYLKSILYSYKTKYSSMIPKFKNIKLHFIILLVKHILIVLNDEDLADEYLGYIIKIIKLERYNLHSDFSDAIFEVCNILLVIQTKDLNLKYIPILLSLPSSKVIPIDIYKLEIGKNFINLLFKTKDDDILTKYIDRLFLYFHVFNSERESYQFFSYFIDHILKLKDRKVRKKIVRILISTYTDNFNNDIKDSIKKYLIKSSKNSKYTSMLLNKNPTYFKKMRELENEFKEGELTEVGFTKLISELNKEYGIDQLKETTNDDT